MATEEIQTTSISRRTASPPSRPTSAVDTSSGRASSHLILRRHTKQADAVLFAKRRGTQSADPAAMVAFFTRDELPKSFSKPSSITGGNIIIAHRHAVIVHK